jgi:hypothetical protein
MLARDMKIRIADLEAENGALRDELRRLYSPPAPQPRNDLESALAELLGHPAGIFDDPSGHPASVLRSLVLRHHLDEDFTET